MYDITPTTLNVNGSVSFDVQAFEMDDAAGTLFGPRRIYSSLTSCFSSRYIYYTTQPTTGESGLGQAQTNYSVCTPHGPDHQPCLFTVSLSMASSLVTKQRSSHGTDMGQIILDEGSILGGVLFFTWFFGIFVI